MSNDLLNVFDNPIRYLKVVGIWIDKKSHIAHITFAIILHLLLVDIFMILSVVYLFTVDNVFDFSEAIGTVPTFVGVCIKSLNITYRKTQIEMLLKLLRKIIQEETMASVKERKLTKRIAKINKVFKACVILLTAAAATNPLAIFLTHKLPLKMWFPFDYETSELLFGLSAFYQLMGTFIFTPVMLIVDLFPIFFLCFAAGAIDKLCDRLNNIGIAFKAVKDKQADKKDLKEEHYKELVKCIETHLKIRNLVDAIRSIFGTILWMQALMSTLILCTTAFNMTLVSDKNLDTQKS